MRKSSALLVAFVLAACGGGDVIGVPDDPVPLPMCEDVPRISADADRYRPQPVYVGNEMPIEEVLEWAEAQPGFQTLWIDRDRNGWLTVAFDTDAAARQSDVERLFADDGVVVVGVDWSLQEMTDLQRSIPERFESGFVRSTGFYDDRGVVGVGIGPLTNDNIAKASRELAGEPVCLEGFDPALVPEPGPQPEVGDGWRLLADERVGETYRTAIATSRPDLETLWREVGLSSSIPDVDFDSEVVIWFGAVYGSSCPNLRLDDVVVEDGVVFPIIVDVDGPQGCTADANPRAFVVAVERSKFPADGFVIQLQEDEPPPGVVTQQTWVHGDVTIPGAYVAGTPGQLPGEEPGPPHVEYGGVVEPGYVWTYDIDTHCGVEWLGELNGVQWRAEDLRGMDVIPDEWMSAVDEAEVLTAEIVLHTGQPPVLEATVNGHTVRYLPADVDPPGCD